MSTKKFAASATPRQRPGRTPLGSAGDVLPAICLAVFCLAYLTLFLRTRLPESPVQMTRGELLRLRVFLPEGAVADWFGTPPEFGLFDRWPIIGAAALILSVGWLTGRLLLRSVGLRCSESGLTRLEHFLFASGAGLNAISLYVLAIGLLGALDRWSVAIPTIGILAVSGWSVLRERRARQALETEPAAAAVSQAPRAANADDGISPRWLWLVAPFAAVILLGGMLPPIDFDVREYHLQAPKEFFQAGKVSFLPHNVYASMPLGSEMFSLLAMLVLDDWWLGALAGKTLIAAFAPLTALALVAAGRRFASVGAGVMAAMLYLSIPWIYVVSTSGLVEGVLAFYLLLAFYAVLTWRKMFVGWPSHAVTQIGDGPGGPSFGDAENLNPAGVRCCAWLALAGFCAGGAVSCKYPAVVFVVVPLFLYIAFSSGKAGLKPLGVFTLAVVAGCGLWFVKNWALTGNPVYPLLYDWLGGATRTAEKNARWLRIHSPHDFTLPALAESLAAVAWKSSWLSPILAPLAVSGLLARRHRALAILLAGYFAYVITAWWLFTHRIDRFWLPALPLLALLAGLGAARSASLAWRRTVLSLLVAAGAISFVYVTSPISCNAYFVSLQTARRDARWINPWHLVLNQQVPAEGKVLSVGDAGIFDLRAPVLYNTVFDDSPAAIFDHRDPREIAAELRRRGVSHVYVDWSEIARYRLPGNYGGVPDVVTPGWFAGLVEQGVLGAPWRIRFLPNQMVYPVQ